MTNQRKETEWEARKRVGEKPFDKPEEWEEEFDKMAESCVKRDIIYWRNEIVQTTFKDFIKNLLATQKEKERKVIEGIEKLPVSIETDVWDNTYHTVKKTSVLTILKEKF